MNVNIQVINIIRLSTYTIVNHSGDTNMKILFYDVVAPRLYTQLTLLETGLGGTEATITRVAHALKNHHTIYIAQHLRTTEQNQLIDDVHYISCETANNLTPDVVILLRHYSWLEKIATLFPTAQRFFWLHNMPSKSLFRVRDSLAKHHYQIIAVSHFHCRQIERRLYGKWYQRLFSFDKKISIPVHVIYNPIADHLTPNNTCWKPKQMILASSPYKGIKESLALFTHVLNHFPEYELLIATYADWDSNIKLPKQAKFLGSLSHAQVIQHFRESFCVFYPQPIRCETFGLVYAEANAVGTPVLAHHFGAASEVLSHTTQLIDGFNPHSIIAKITEWRDQRPILTARDEFRLNSVLQSWLALFAQ